MTVEIPFYLFPLHNQYLLIKLFVKASIVLWLIWLHRHLG